MLSQIMKEEAAGHSIPVNCASMNRNPPPSRHLSLRTFPRPSNRVGRNSLQRNAVLVTKSSDNGFRKRRVCRNVAENFRLLLWSSVCRGVTITDYIRRPMIRHAAENLPVSYFGFEEIFRNVSRIRNLPRGFFMLVLRCKGV